MNSGQIEGKLLKKLRLTQGPAGSSLSDAKESMMSKAKQLLMGLTMTFTLVLAGSLANQAEACPCSEKKQVTAKKKQVTAKKKQGTAKKKNGTCKAPKAPKKTAKQKQGKAGADKPG
jgi:hypothetical protein